MTSSFGRRTSNNNNADSWCANSLSREPYPYREFEMSEEQFHCLTNNYLVFYDHSQLVWGSSLARHGTEPDFYGTAELSFG